MSELYSHEDDEIDINSQPDIEVPCLPELVSSGDIHRRGKAFGRYAYGGVLVPRVTAILNYCEGDQEGFKKYAARLGYRYEAESKRVLSVGTNVHNAVEEFLSSGTIECIRDIPEEQRDEVYQSVSNFISWYDHVTKDLGWKVEIILSEVPIICPWCGGTLDALLSINNRRYLVDFKSSKKLTPEYFIQVSAYLWMIENYYPEYLPINGLGLIRIDKFTESYQDVFLDLSDPNDNVFIRHCQETFGIALRMFYAMNILEREVKDVEEEERQEATKSNM